MNARNESPAAGLPNHGLLNQALPYLYGKWIGQLLEASIPEEQAATCDSCAMCIREESEPERDTFYFNPAVKCCTYVPELPNFLVGAILADEDGDMAIGRISVKQRLTAGVGVTPLGLSPSPETIRREALSSSTTTTSTVSLLPQLINSLAPLTFIAMSIPRGRFVIGYHIVIAC